MTKLENLENSCFIKAQIMIEKGLVKLSEEMDIFKLADLLIKLEKEKLFKDSLNDEKIDYNDEIVSIEEVGTMETVDISVSGDNLFYCNDILTKNSFGLPATADFMFALISTEELESVNQIMVKQLKNRFSDTSSNRRFVVGIDRSKMRLYNLEESAQEGIMKEPQEEKEIKKKVSFDKEKFKKTFG